MQCCVYLFAVFVFFLTNKVMFSAKTYFISFTFIIYQNTFGGTFMPAGHAAYKINSSTEFR